MTKFCCKVLKEYYESKIYTNGKSTKIPALKDKKHLLCFYIDTLYSICPAYGEMFYCPNCGAKLE